MRDRYWVLLFISLFVLLFTSLFSFANYLQTGYDIKRKAEMVIAHNRCVKICNIHEGGAVVRWQSIGFNSWEHRCFCADAYWVVIP